MSVKYVFFPPNFSYQWVRFEVCRPGDGQVAHGLSEDDASVNFESFQRVQNCEESLTSQNLTTEHSSTGQTTPQTTTNHYCIIINIFVVVKSHLFILCFVLY